MTQRMFSEKIQDPERELKLATFQDCIDYITTNSSKIVIDKIDEDLIVYKKAMKNSKKVLKKWIEMECDGIFAKKVIIEDVEYDGFEDANKLYVMTTSLLKKQQERLSAEYKKKVAQKQQQINKNTQRTR